MNTKEYLAESLKDKNVEGATRCMGWKYLEANVPEELKGILGQEAYWKLTYNDEKVNFIMRELGLELTEELKEQLGSFVYIFNEKRREDEKAAKEREILAQGYEKIAGTQKELDRRKVKGIFNISTLSIMGSFDKLTEMEGTLIYSEQRKCLMLMPKRSRTRGYLIRDFAYIKKEVGA